MPTLADTARCTACTLVGLLMLGCGVHKPAMPHVPSKQDYANTHAARAADDGDFALHPDPSAERVMRVQASGFSSRSVWRAVFYSDGILQVEERAYDGPTRRSSAQLSAAELQRLQTNMPALDLCRRNAAACIREDDIDAPHVTFEILAGPMHGQFVEHIKGSQAPTDFLHYEDFVIGLIAQTLE